MPTCELSDFSIAAMSYYQFGMWCKVLQQVVRLTINGQKSLHLFATHLVEDGAELRYIGNSQGIPIHSTGKG